MEINTDKLVDILENNDPLSLMSVDEFGKEKLIILFALPSLSNEITPFAKDLLDGKSYSILSTEHAKMVEILQDLRNCRETWSDLFQSDKDRIEEVLSSIKKGGSDEL